MLKHQEVSPLVAAYLGRRGDLVRFFTLRLRSAEAAEDLVQEIYLKVVALDPGRQIDNPAGYLHRLGSNLMLDRLRGERRAAVRDSEWRDSYRTVAGAEDVADDPRPEDVIAARQRLEAVVRALADLNPQTQRVFRLHKFDGMTHAEVAQALGISRSGVEKHVSAALRHLTKRLK
jgi:RNA polymerase sigma-70 factor (ECF subfamily)